MLIDILIWLVVLAILIAILIAIGYAWTRRRNKTRRPGYGGGSPKDTHNDTGSKRGPGLE